MIRTLTIIGVLVTGAFAAPSSDPVVDELVRNITAEPSYDLSKVPVHRREEVIRRLREVARAESSYVLLGTAMVSPMAADLQLLRLGDILTIERMMKTYRAYDSMASWSYVQAKFERSRQPKLIPYLAEDLYLEEDPDKGLTISPPHESTSFAVVVPPRSIFSGVTVTRIIEHSSEFAPEMKAWARSAYALRLESPQRFRRSMRAWWEVNKAAFERGDYKGVVPTTEEVGPFIPEGDSQGQVVNSR